MLRYPNTIYCPYSVSIYCPYSVYLSCSWPLHSVHVPLLSLILLFSCPCPRSSPFVFPVQFDVRVHHDPDTSVLIHPLDQSEVKNTRKQGPRQLPQTHKPRGRCFQETTPKQAVSTVSESMWLFLSIFFLTVCVLVCSITGSASSFVLLLYSTAITQSSSGFLDFTTCSFVFQYRHCVVFNIHKNTL